MGTALALFSLFIPAACHPVATSATDKPAAQPSTADACRLPAAMPEKTRIAVVAAFATPEQAAKATAANQAKLHAQLSPDYASQRRAFVSVEAGGLTLFRGIAVVPATIPVAIGDEVEIVRFHRDDRFPCSYVPPLIRRIVRTASQRGAIAPAANTVGTPLDDVDAWLNHGEGQAIPDTAPPNGTMY